MNEWAQETGKADRKRAAGRRQKLEVKHIDTHTTCEYHLSECAATLVLGSLN